jgi:hypothetical protein
MSSAPSDDNGSYYSLLARGFLSGNLYLPVEPSPNLLRLTDPYDPTTNAAYRLHDASLFEGRYYLYFGPPPALLAMPGILAGVALDMRVVTAFVALSLVVLALALVKNLAPGSTRNHRTLFFLLSPVALAFGSLLPIALRRVAVYEVAIVCGSGLAIASLLATSHALKTCHRPGLRSTTISLVIAGACAGLAVWTRPSWIVLIITTGLVLALTSPGARALARFLTLFLIPILLIGLAAATYNMLRFRNPTEFGNTYQLAGVRAADIRASTFFDIVEKLRIDFLVLPQTSSQFPFLTLSGFSGPFDMSDFFAEPSVGLFFAVPAIPLMAIAFVFLACRRRMFLSTTSVMLVSLPITAMLVLVVQGAVIPATSFRYLIDVSPLMIVFVLAMAFRLLDETRVLRATAILALLTIIVVTIPTVTMLSMTGYYNTLQSGSPSVWAALERVTGPISVVLQHRAPQP